MIFAAAAFSFLVGGMVLPEPRFERRESFTAYEVSQLSAAATTANLSPAFVTMRALGPEAYIDLDAILIAGYGDIGEEPVIIAVYNCVRPRLNGGGDAASPVGLTCGPFGNPDGYLIQWQDDALLIDGVSFGGVNDYALSEFPN